MQVQNAEKSLEFEGTLLVVKSGHKSIFKDLFSLFTIFRKKITLHETQQI